MELNNWALGSENTTEIGYIDQWADGFKFEKYILSEEDWTVWVEPRTTSPQKTKVASVENE